MSFDDFDPELYKAGREVTKKVFGDPDGGKKKPKAHSRVPRWNKKRRLLATSNPEGYFRYPGMIDWGRVPEVDLGVPLHDPVMAMEHLDERWDAQRDFYLIIPRPHPLAGLPRRRGIPSVGSGDGVFGMYQIRTWYPLDTKGNEIKLKGAVLIRIWRRFGIRVRATWADQTDYHPAGGAPMNAYGLALRQEYEDWSPGAWEWHEGEYIDPKRMYYRFQFPDANIRLLFHLIEELRLVFSVPPPRVKAKR